MLEAAQESLRAATQRRRQLPVGIQSDKGHDRMQHRIQMARYCIRWLCVHPCARALSRAHTVQPGAYVQTPTHAPTRDVQYIVQSTSLPQLSDLSCSALTANKNRAGSATTPPSRRHPVQFHRERRLGVPASLLCDQHPPCVGLFTSELPSKHRAQVHCELDLPAGYVRFMHLMSQTRDTPRAPPSHLSTHVCSPPQCLPFLSRPLSVCGCCFSLLRTAKSPWVLISHHMCETY